MSTARTFSLLTVLNLTSTALGVASSVVIAYIFGTSRAVEVYFAAVGLHATIASLAQTGQVSEVMLPAYLSMREIHGRTLAYRAYSALMNRFLLVLSAVAVAGWLLAVPLTRWRVPGFESADIVLAAKMLHWILPLVVLQIATALLKTLANAERFFGSPETANIVARAVSLMLVLLLARKLGAWAMIVALWGAGLVELAGILLILRGRQYRYQPVLALPDSMPNVNFFGKLASTLPYIGATQLFTFVLDAAVSHLTQGSFAVFRYATIIWARTSGIFVQPLTTPFFTEMSEATARQSPSKSRVTEDILARVVAVAAVVTAAVVAGAEPILTAFWGGAKFPPAQIAQLVWLIGGLYALLPIGGPGYILRKVTVSLQLVRQTYLALAALQLVNAVVAWTIVRQFGLLGVIVVNAVSAVGTYMSLAAVLRFAGSDIRIRYPFGRLCLWLASAIVGAALGLFVSRWLIGNASFGSAGRFSSFAIGCVSSAISAGATLICSMLLRVPEALHLRVRLQEYARQLLQQKM